MLIVCPSCATSYQVEPASLGHSGRSVRCARCQTVWFASVPTVVSADAWDVIDTGPRVPSVDAARAEPPPTDTAPEYPEPSEPLAGIDVAGLSADITAERAEQEA